MNGFRNYFLVFFMNVMSNTPASTKKSQFVLLQSFYFCLLYGSYYSNNLLQLFIIFNNYIKNGIWIINHFLFFIEILCSIVCCVPRLACFSWVFVLMTTYFCNLRLISSHLHMQQFRKIIIYEVWKTHTLVYYLICFYHR